MNKTQDNILKDIDKSLLIIAIFSVISSILFFVAYITLHLIILLIAVIVILCSLPIVYILALRMKNKYMLTKEKADNMNLVEKKLDIN